MAQPQGAGYSPYSIANAKDAYNFIRTAATNAAAGVGGALFGLPDPITQLPQPGGPSKDPAADIAKASGHIADRIYDTPVVGGPEYQPQTTAGKYGMDAATFALPAVLDPGAVLPNLIRGGAAGLAAHGANEVGLPAWAGPAATTGAETLTRKGLGLFRLHTIEGAALTGGKIVNEERAGRYLTTFRRPFFRGCGQQLGSVLAML